MKREAVKHPLIFSAIIVVVFFISMVLVSTGLMMYGPKFLTNNGEYLYQATVECFVALVGIGLVFLFGFGGIWGEKGKGFLSGIFTGGYFICVALLTLLSNAMIFLEEYISGIEHDLAPGWKIAVFVICMTLVGFTEEVFFRGVVANLFYEKHAHDPAGIWTATIWSGLVFGLLHMMNILGSDPVGVIVQVISATAMGMALTAIYYRCRNIWALAFIHAFNNICAGLVSSFFEDASLSEMIGSYSPVNCISAIPFIIVTAVLLRPSKLRDMLPVQDPSLINPDEKIAQYIKSKRSKAVATFVALFICIGLFITSVALGFDQLVSDFNLIMDEMNSQNTFIYSVSESWSGEDHFEDKREMTISETGDYTLTIMSYPGDSKAYMTLVITSSSGETVFESTYGGRCSDTKTISLEAGETYTVLVKYDYSGITDGTQADYVTNIIIE